MQSKTYDLKKKAEFFEASGEKNAYTRVSVEIEPKSDGSGESNLTIGAYDQNDKWHELENWTDFNPEKDSIKDAEAWDEWGIEPPTE